MSFLHNKQRKINGKLRILYFTPLFTFTHSGKETYFVKEIDALLRNYRNIEFLVYFKTKTRPNGVIKYSDRILQVNRRSYKNALFFKDMIKIFTKFKPDVIHSHYVVPSIFINFFAKIFRVPTILHGRGLDIHYFPYFSVKSKILLLIAGKLNNMILTVSKSMKNDCLRFKIPKNKVRVVYNGIDFEEFNPKEKTFFSNKNPLELLHIGSFLLAKGQHLIIEACKQLKDNNIKFHLTLIGDGILKQTIVNLINKYELENYVDLMGWVEHNKIPDYLQKADVLVFPSSFEGLPNSVLEAMSMKLVVILTRVGGNLELAQDIGSVLVDKNNSQQLFEAILHYYNNPKKIEIGGEINRNFIVKRFSWDRHAEELYQVYNFISNKRKNKDDKKENNP